MSVRADQKLRLDRNYLLDHRFPIGHDVAHSGSRQLFHGRADRVFLFFESVEPMIPFDLDTVLFKQALFEDPFKDALGRDDQEWKSAAEVREPDFGTTRA